ncbi:hypothetical protein [Psychroflexus tropicus]|uniref:hypothetical protein n=1 Tax=Psychroflexus tropicus TaxID=197345 RepID=UPI00036DC136|nr:hypothetical protein [Psychroflexus tropicus]
MNVYSFYLKDKLVMLLLGVISITYLGCTDDRDFDTDDFELNPIFELNVFEAEYSAGLINTGNDSIPVQNSIRDFIDVDFLNEEFNVDNLVELEFKFLAENSINRRQTIDFVFFDVNNIETFRVTEPIPAGSVDNPTIKTFSVALTPQELETITTSIRAEFLVNQPASNSNSGRLRMECVVEGSYEFAGE